MGVRIAGTFLGLVAAVAFAACASRGARIETTDIENANLPQRDTFAWKPARLVEQGGEATPAQAQQLESIMRREVTTALDRKGYVETNPESADFLVTYQIVVRQRTTETVRDVTSPSVTGSVGPGDPLDIVRDAQSGERTITATEGSLLVFATDRDTGRILWRGVAEDTTTSTRQALREIPGVVRRMMTDFPERAR